MDTGRPEMLKERFWYWLSYPVYHKKNIWLTFDKIYKGGDCGEYFYKYCVSRKDTDVVPVYLMNEEARYEAPSPGGLSATDSRNQEAPLHISACKDGICHSCWSV